MKANSTAPRILETAWLTAARLCIAKLLRCVARLATGVPSLMLSPVFQISTRSATLSHRG